MDIQIPQRHRLIRRYGWIVTVTAIVAATLVWALTAGRTSTFRISRNAITTGAVTQGSFNDYIRLNGRVETGVIVQVSALEAGIVERKWVEEGAMVKAGDVILTLRNPMLRQQILDSESQLAEKQNMLRDTEITMEKERLQLKRDIISAKTELNRKSRAARTQESLFREELTSREEYMQAMEENQLASENLRLLEERLRQDSLYRNVQLAMMKESLDNMRENFTLVRQRADNLNITATHSGQLGSLSAELGQNIPAGQQIGQINILDNYKISVQIDEHYIDRITPGLEGAITRNGKRYGVRVSKVYPEVTDGRFRADLIADGTLPAHMRVGQTYTVDILLGEATETLMVPRGSFFNTSAGKWVYVIDSDGKTASRRNIRTGRQNPGFYEITEGLTPGERIITSSYSDFGNADKIIITD